MNFTDPSGKLVQRLSDRGPDAETAEHPRPLRGNWQITFDRQAGCFVSLRTDNTGIWAEQRSPGWEGNEFALTGAAIGADPPRVVRDTLLRIGADELRFLVDFQIEGAWARFIELSCERSK